MRTRALAVVAATVLAATAALSGVASAAKPTGPEGGASPQIIGGQPADEPYPYAASLQNRPDPNRPNPHRCGAALITPKWLVTAAHCVATLDGTPLEPSKYLVRIGSTDNQAGTAYAIEKFAVNPLWGAGQESIGDLALIKLRYRPRLPQIAVAPPPAPGAAVRLLGWGRTVEDDPASLPRKLQQLDSTLLPYDNCIHGDPYDITPGDLCVDMPGGKAGICSGDSGSPLLWKSNGAWQLLGVASRVPGEVGCLNGPSVYTGVDYYQDWIQEELAKDEHTKQPAGVGRS